ncbi:hypothetical protein NA56DRAFT_680630 [Hyaloscypha hepaticicola]|uniref:protein-ribulosamine 3-kinase n=1 Tax=Hyaloscypha hepaticicola TaxID=2082293 RepID=A0A2J6PXA3_9HELO|nr:hypothetical protein NA56DRAFT_680630 [Hyaloscypha hepaticicola]
MARVWTQTAGISTTLPDGTPKSYFLKVVAGALGLGMVEGEYESIAAIHAVKRGFCPKPQALGTFKTNPDLHFLLTDFLEMEQEIPENHAFTAMLADFHLASAMSLNGKFGFHCTTYNGNLAQDNTWTDTWEEYYKNNILVEKVIPRLLRPLETGPITLQPCLIHGDLSYGIPIMRPAGVQFGRKYLNAYPEKFRQSEPTEDAEDRLALYALCVRSRIHDSALYPMNAGFRNLVIEQMKLLVEKYPNGYEEPNTKSRTADRKVETTS